MTRPYTKLTVTLVLFATAFLANEASALAASFTAGHFYAPVDDGWIINWNQQLDEVSRFQVADIDTVTGATFNDRGNLVFIARRFGSVHVLEVGASGSILNDFDTGRGSLLRGSYIDFDPKRQVYVFADDDRLTYLDSNLAFLRSTVSLFDRASGVVFDGEGNVFATDQFENKISVFNKAGALTEQLPFSGFVPVGVDIAPGNRLLVALFGDGKLDQLDLASNQRSTLISGLGYGGISDIQVLPDGRLLAIDPGGRLSLFSASGVLMDSNNGNTGVGGSGDSAVLFVSEPASIFLASCACLLLAVSRLRLENRP